MLLQRLWHELRKDPDVGRLREWRDEILADVGWTLISETAAGCIVGPKCTSRAKSILLRGTALSNRPLPDLQNQIHLRNTVMKNSRVRRLDAWKKLAGHNVATLGKGQWPEIDPAVELDAILTPPRHQLLPHHPGLPSPTIESPCSRWTKVADALTAILKRTLRSSGPRDQQHADHIVERSALAVGNQSYLNGEPHLVCCGAAAQSTSHLRTYRSCFGYVAGYQTVDANTRCGVSSTVNCEDVTQP